ncbi:hypothetical protein HELRODRAFT_163449 [Helobdella robusta]|uniref:CIP2A N-terminal domain-containing protein n=1 Tax=Helobdella robusta TaxID=6412 RepID=T1EU24_HELRO|nr:hypothetical protein HELRODRAFT_163449 [Helobdella robusta]ESN96390.1 hypothetical protein HELRODRAFT_163449 [Helobdella robusta]
MEGVGIKVSKKRKRKFTMEVTACAKTFVLSVNQYKCNCSSEDAQSHLMRQIDVLTTITAKGSSLLFFESTEILQSECMTSIISLLNDYTIIKSTPLINKTLSLLSNLANSDIVKDCLRDTFDLPNILLNVFRSTLSSSDELSISLCVRLLQKLTYKAALPYPVMKLNELLHYLLQQICQASPSGECMQPYLSLLSNLTHESQHVQMFIKSIDNLKAVLKKFMSFMSHTNQKMCISSIAILHNLKLDKCIAGQIFTPSNVTQIFQLLFNILNNSKINKTNSAQHYAVDLYKHLSTCLSLLINGLSMQNVHHFNVILELLINFSSETKLKEIIFKIIFDNPLCQSVSLDVESLVNKTNIDNAPQLDTSNYNNSTKYNNNINSTNNNYQLEIMNMMRVDILIPVLSRLLNKLLSTKMLSSKKLIICLRILKYILLFMMFAFY